MTQEIIEMAKQAGFELDDSLAFEPEVVWYISQGQLEAFAKLVAAKEREACIELTDSRCQCAWLIRARGNA
jgi:hypothetical protein